jgi:hypothetical protein
MSAKIYHFPSGKRMDVQTARHGLADRLAKALLLLEQSRLASGELANDPTANLAQRGDYLFLHERRNIDSLVLPLLFHFEPEDSRRLELGATSIH